MKSGAVLHDFNARNDPKAIKLRVKLGYEGYGLFWALVEMMGEAASEGYKLDHDAHLLSAVLYAPAETIERVIEFAVHLGLFESDGTKFWSPSLMRRMNAWEEKRERYAEAGRKSGEARRSKQPEQPVTDESECSKDVERENDECSNTETSDVRTSLEGCSKDVPKSFELTRNTNSNTNTNPNPRSEGGSGGKPTAQNADPPPTGSPPATKKPKKPPKKPRFAHECDWMFPELWGPEARKSFAEWLQYRAEHKRDPVTVPSAVKLIESYAKRPREFKAAVDFTIEKDWIGLREPPPNGSNGHSNGNGFEPHTAARTAQKNLEYVLRKEREERGGTLEQVGSSGVLSAFINVQKKLGDE